MVNDNFDNKSEDDLQINYDIILILPSEYDRVSEVSETEEDYIHDEAYN